MAKVLPVVLHPHPVLRQKAVAVAQVDDEIRALLANMLETLYAAHGVGLAAPQVAVGKKVVVIHSDIEGEPGQRVPRAGSKPLMMVNPQIMEHSEELIDSEEGCLSIPRMYDVIQRFKWVKVAYLDEQGNPREVEGEGLLGRCLQHELDHLEGIVFPDHLSRLKRERLWKKYSKAVAGFDAEVLGYPVRKA
ncbi:MAG: peptide deformylase [Proteobacteria bacterium]|nr:peptide deformylase [Pseudomonadota bacterium]NBX86740.1 peptide deformylase [Pseudomonadota bacterium]